MKAFVFAAGPGTRLGALTSQTPKCLLPIAGKPILHWSLTLLERAGVTEALINTHHLAEQVAAFAASWRGACRLTLVHEPRLLGSAGTLSANRAFVSGEPAFWTLYADTLIADDLSKLASLHREKSPAMTMGLFRASDPRACGIAELDGEGRLLSFEEKPARPKSDLAAAGICLFGPAVFDHLGPDSRDLGRDVWPRLVGRAYGCELKGPVIDIGTPRDYERAKDAWPAPARAA